MTAREMLTLAAKAMGRAIAVMPDSIDDWRWRPDEDSGDCAELCAALGIASEFFDGPSSVIAWRGDIRRVAYSADHANDRAAAWRMAAVRVASEIGRAM